MFRRLRFKLALQFTALVFLLMLVLGAVFIAIEFTDVNRQLDTVCSARRRRSSTRSRSPSPSSRRGGSTGRRSTSSSPRPCGRVLYASDIFARLPVGLDAPPLRRCAPTEAPIASSPRSSPEPATSSLQLAGQDRIGPAELPGEIAVFFIAAVLVSVLTAVLGFWFARRSLAPAERMFERLTQFTHDASHELRTPLAVVNSELDLALRTGDHEEHIIAAKDELKVGARPRRRPSRARRPGHGDAGRPPVDLSALVRREVERLASPRGAKGSS